MSMATTPSLKFAVRVVGVALLGSLSIQGVNADESTRTVAAPTALLASPETLAQESDDESKKKKRSSKKARSSSKKNGGKTTGVSSDAKFVKKHLKRVLSPDKVKFLKGGKVTLIYEFSEKNEAQEDIFLPKMGSGIKAPFRWSARGEEYWIGSGTGIRISDKGMALLDCWFEDDVDATFEFMQHVNQNPRLVTALTFTNEKGVSIGSNFGSQCATFKRGRMGKKSRTKAQPVSYNTNAIVRLQVKKGTFSAFRGKSKTAKANMKYPERSFDSGRIGFIWSGSQAATIGRLEITGKLDLEKTAKMLRKRLK